MEEKNRGHKRNGRLHSPALKKENNFYKLSPYRAVNTLRLGYKTQSVNIV